MIEARLRVDSCDKSLFGCFPRTVGVFSRADTHEKVHSLLNFPDEITNRIKEQHTTSPMNRI